MLLCSAPYFRTALACALLVLTPTLSPGQAPGSWIGDLAPIEAKDWNYDRAAHLLERAGFGGTPQEIRALAAMSPQQAVQHLVRYQNVEDVPLPKFAETGIYPSPDWTRFHMARAFSAILTGNADKLPPPQRTELMDEASNGVTTEMARIAKTDKQAVVDKFYLNRNVDLLETFRAATWLADRALKSRRPLQENLVFFWHGHFATGNEKVRDYRMMLTQFSMLRENANGNLRDLLIGVGKDPAMLLYLDNNQNIKGHPNENFAREIMELFSLGVGNYSETDIKEAARAFSGWTLTPTGKFVNRAQLHDDAQKTILGKTGNWKGEDVVDILLQQPACGRFIARKLYKYFVREDLPKNQEEKLAAILRGSQYQIAPFLETLFLSRDFYSPPSVATRIKSPLHLALSTYRKLGITSAPTYPQFSALTANLGQSVFYPPNVKGWDGGKAWINPATMFDRSNLARYILFPEEMPVIKAANLAGTRRLSGDFVHNQFVEEAEKGDFTSFPNSGIASAMAGPAKGMAGSVDTMNLQGEDYNLFRGVFNAAWMAPAVVPPEPRRTPQFSLAKILKDENITETTAAVDSFLHRFLRSPISGERRAALIQFAARQLGGSRINLEKYNVEKDLREILHLIMSSPEYQLS